MRNDETEKEKLEEPAKDTNRQKERELEGHKFSGQDKTMCFTVMYLYL